MLGYKCQTLFNRTPIADRREPEISFFKIRCQNAISAQKRVNSRKLVSVRFSVLNINITNFSRYLSSAES